MNPPNMSEVAEIKDQSDSIRQEKINPLRKIFKKVNRELLSVKISLFLWFGANATLFPYVAIHMKYLGLSVRQIGIIFSFTPVVKILGRILIGVVADKYHKHKSMVILCFVMTIIFAIATANIPKETAQMIEYLKTTISEINPMKEPGIGSTFWMYLIFRLAFELFASSCYNLLDAIAILKVDQIPGSTFGAQRMWSSISTGTMPALAGLLLDAFAVSKLTESDSWTQQAKLNLTFSNISEIETPNSPNTEIVANYTPIFCLFVAMVLTVILVVTLFIKMDNPVSSETEDSPKNTTGVFSALWPILKKPKTLTVFLALLVLGFSWGNTKVFVPLRMKQLGSSSFLIGIGNTLSMILGVPLVMWSSAIYRKINQLQLMTLTFLVYAIRFLAYAYLQQPVYFLIFEAMEGLTYHLCWVAALTYSVTLTPLSLSSTMIGLAASFHFSIGLGLAGLISGNLIDSFGNKFTFLFIAGFNAIAFIVMVIFCFYLTKSKVNQKDHEMSKL